MRGRRSRGKMLAEDGCPECRVPVSLYRLVVTCLNCGWEDSPHDLAEAFHRHDTVSRHRFGVDQIEGLVADAARGSLTDEQAADLVASARQDPIVRHWLRKAAVADSDWAWAQYLNQAMKGGDGDGFMG